MFIKIITPPKFKSKKEELEHFIEKRNPVLLLEKFTGRKLKKKIAICHRSLKMEARFKNNNIYADFNNEAFYIWICICHELAHIILENPPWYRKKEIAEIIKKNKEKISDYSFKQAVEQVLAILLQAACENEAKIRKLRWSEWELTFDYMRVKELGKKFWNSWPRYLKNISKYKNIDEWVYKQVKNI